jgi:hypothetical protein
MRPTANPALYRTEKSDEELEKMNWNEITKLVQKDPVTCSRFFDHRVQQFIKIVLKSEFHPIGKVNDYFYRVEFQQRGSPHSSLEFPCTYFCVFPHTHQVAPI